MPAASFNVQAPVLGLRTDLPEDAVPPNAALVFDNMISDGANVFVRQGRITYVNTGSGAPVDTLSEWLWQGSAQLLCASGDKILNITNPLAPVSLGTGFVSAQWQWVQHNNFTIHVNGTDSGQKYDGTTLTAWAPTFSGASPPTSADMLVIGTFKERIFVGQKNSLTFWYGAPQAIEGQFDPFPLDSIATKGGVIVAIGTYSRDTGSGPDDFALFVTSQGELIIYSGLDPGNPSAWSLVGVYQHPRPVGLRSLHKPKTSNGAIITEHGFFLIDEILAGIPRVNRRGRAVENAILQSHSRYEFQYGWDVVDYSHGDLTIVNVPNSVGGNEYIQYVAHGSGAWSRFTGWNGRSWIEWQDRLFFGLPDGTVQEGDVGYSEDGDNLLFDVKTGYNYFGDRSRIKRFTGVRVVYRSLGVFPITVDYDVDFEDQAPPYQASSTISVGTPWGSPWGSPWGEPVTLRKDWLAVRGQGYCGSLRVRGSTVAQPFLWYSWEQLFQYGAQKGVV